MSFLNAFWSFMLASSFYLILGITMAGFIHAFINVKTIKKMLGGKGLGSIFKAAFFGIPLPLCSCAVIPTAVTLKKSGASNGATASFLISTPESGIDSIAMTYGLMDLPMTILRPIAAFFSAITAGLLHHFFNPEQEIEEVEETKSCCPSMKKQEEEISLFEKVKEMFSYSYGKLIDDMAFWLALGLVVGSLIEFLAPAEVFAYLNGAGGRFLILLVGIPVYICASATTPIAASLVLKGMSPGSALLLLLVGPATNISNIAILKDYIGVKGIIINVLSIAVVALIFSYIVDYLYGLYAWPLDFRLGHGHHGGHATWWHWASAILLSVLLIKGIYKNEIVPRFKKEAVAGGCH
jgi:uncharacterized membrane protein YraQ (UPF0718 family)